jgi:Zn-dependent membrane protease YugP
MGFKGMIRDIIMFYIGLQLVLGGANTFNLGIILIITSVIFTIIGFVVAFGGG